MKHYRVIDVPATKQNIVDHVTCDICGGRISDVAFEVDEIEVRHRVGESYPEASYGTEVRIDMCGDCFDEKLIPWIKSQGAVPRTEEWEY